MKNKLLFRRPPAGLDTAVYLFAHPAGVHLILDEVLLFNPG